MGTIGQNRQTTRAPSFVGAGQNRWIEIGGEIAFGGRPPLDLTDDGQRIHGVATQSSFETTRRRRRRGRFDQLGRITTIGTDPIPMEIEDAVEIRAAPSAHR